MDTVRNKLQSYYFTNIKKKNQTKSETVILAERKKKIKYLEYKMSSLNKKATIKPYQINRKKVNGPIRNVTRVKYLYTQIMNLTTRKEITGRCSSVLTALFHGTRSKHVIKEKILREQRN